MKKLGLTGDQPPKADDVEAYIQAFRWGLTEEQAKLITKLFLEHTPAPTEVGADV